MAGQLFVVATPIGNLADITLRAIETLKAVDLIAAEDTRTSGVLLSRHGIATATIALHEHNEEAAARRLLAELQAGKSVALISDAGTPLISDPGYRLLRLLRAEGVEIHPIPGACSPIVALSAAGLPTDQFAFLGFPPRAGGARTALLEQIAGMKMTAILLESPNRLLDTLKELAPHMQPGRELCVARELTKLYETFVNGPVEVLIDHFTATPPRGEIVLLIGPAPHDWRREVSDAELLAAMAAPEFAAMPPSARAKAVAKRFAVERDRVYALAMGQR